MAEYSEPYEQGKFLQSIQENLDPIRSWAAQYHRNGRRPTIFQPLSAGSFNACVFLHFDEEPCRRLVLKIANPAFPLIRKRIKTSVATMVFLRAHSSIPVPDVIDYDYSFTNGIQSAFILESYIKGKSLSEMGFISEKRTSSAATKAKMKEGLRNLFSELDRLTFAAIGSLGLPVESHEKLNKCNPSLISVQSQPVTAELVELVRLGYLSEIEAEQNELFHSTAEFLGHLAYLSDVRFDKSGELDLHKLRAKSTLYTQEKFHELVQETWEDSTQRFCLVHADLEHGDNLRFNERGELVAVLDWEFSFVGPTPVRGLPPWALGTDYDSIVKNQTKVEYKATYEKRAAEMLTPCDITGRRWTPSQMCQTMVTTALLNSTEIYEAFWQLFNEKHMATLGREMSNSELSQHSKSVLAAYMTPKRYELRDRKAVEQAAFWAAGKQNLKFKDTELNKFLHHEPAHDDLLSVRIWRRVWTRGGIRFTYMPGEVFSFRLIARVVWQLLPRALRRVITSIRRY